MVDLRGTDNEQMLDCHVTLSWMSHSTSYIVTFDKRDTCDNVFGLLFDTPKNEDCFIGYHRETKHFHALNLRDFEDQCERNPHFVTYPFHEQGESITIMTRRLSRWGRKFHLAFIAFWCNEGARIITPDRSSSYLNSMLVTSLTNLTAQELDDASVYHVYAHFAVDRGWDYELPSCCTTVAGDGKCSQDPAHSDGDIRLPCGHSFCRPCLEKLAASTGHGEALRAGSRPPERCPRCSKPLPSGTFKACQMRYRPGTMPHTKCGASGAVPRPLKTCSGCSVVFYCYRECQASHWKAHKPDCKKLKTYTEQ